MKVESVKAIVEGLKEAGVNFISLMPDSEFVPVQREIEKDPYFKCVTVSNESIGIAVCAGAWLGGKVPAFLCPTSGLLVASWPLAAVGLAWGIPIILLIPYRGDIGDGFWVMRTYYYTTKQTLETLQIPYLTVSKIEEIKDNIKSLRRSAAGWLHPVSLLLTGETIQ